MAAGSQEHTPSKGKHGELALSPAQRKSPFVSTRIQLKTADLREHNARVVQTMRDREEQLIMTVVGQKEDFQDAISGKIEANQ